MMHPYDIKAGGVFKAHRLTRKIPLEKLGEAVGVSFQQIQKYENGSNRISCSRFILLCDALCISPVSVMREICIEIGDK